MTLKLFLIDECEEHCLYETYTIGDELDDDYIELWKEIKMNKAKERYPEARGFYWENPADIQHLVNLAIRGYESDEEAIFNQYYASECCEECSECEYEDDCPYSGNCPF